MSVPSPVRFSGSESPSVEELAGGVPVQINVVTDAAGALRLRPGIATWPDFPLSFIVGTAPAVIGITAWNGNIIYVTEDRNIWAVTTPGTVVALSSAVLATKLDGGLRPVFTATRTRIIISGGGKPQKWEGAGLSSRLGGSPPAMSHITAISQRIAGNDSGVSGIVYWSGIGDTGAETWTTGLNFREAETKQDSAIGLYENSNELVVLGTETIQMLSPDPVETFTNARTIEIGWGAPSSYIGLDQQFMGLDSKDRAILCDGRSFRDISSPFVGKDLSEMTSTSDCWGARYPFHNYDFGLLNFPTDGRTLAYETKTKSWAEWRGYDTVRAGLGAFGGALAFRVTSAYFWEAKRIMLVGLANGQIAMLDPSATDDLGTPITAQVTSTFEDRKTSRLKQCSAVRLRFRRGGDSTGTAVALYSYRDNTGGFCEPYRITIGDSSDVEPVVEIRTLGTYRQRQHRIVVDSGAFSFADMDEDFTVLAN